MLSGTATWAGLTATGYASSKVKDCPRSNQLRLILPMPALVYLLHSTVTQVIKPYMVQHSVMRNTADHILANTPNSQVQDVVWAVRRTLEIGADRRGCAAVAQADVSQQFDRLPWGRSFVALLRRGVPIPWARAAIRCQAEPQIKAMFTALPGTTPVIDRDAGYLTGSPLSAIMSRMQPEDTFEKLRLKWSKEQRGFLLFEEEKKEHQGKGNSSNTKDTQTTATQNSVKSGRYDMTDTTQPQLSLEPPPSLPTQTQRPALHPTPSPPITLTSQPAQTDHPDVASPQQHFVISQKTVKPRVDRLAAMSWADNLITFGNEAGEAMDLMRDWADLIWEDWGGELKEGSCEVISERFEEAQAQVSSRVGWTPVTSMSLLGAIIENDGSTMKELASVLAKTISAFWSNKAIFLNPAISTQEKFHLLDQRITPPWLSKAASWVVSKNAAHLLDAQQRKYVVWMCGIRMRPDETPSAFVCRRGRETSGLIENLSVPWSRRWFLAAYSWIGHVNRHQNSCLLSLMVTQGHEWLINRRSEHAGVGRWTPVAGKTNTRLTKKRPHRWTLLLGDTDPTTVLDHEQARRIAISRWCDVIGPAAQKRLQNLLQTNL